MKGLGVEAKSPERSKVATELTAGMETASPPTSDLWIDGTSEECLPEPSTALTTKELPRGYGEDVVVLLARDPTWLFAYWEITAEGWARVRQDLSDGQCSPTLRVYDLGPQGQQPTGFFDVAVQPFADRWHINTGKVGCRFRVDIGIRTPTGDFRPIAASNIIQMPRGRMSSAVANKWLRIEEFWLPTAAFPPGGSPMGWLKQRKAQLSELEGYPTSPGIFSPMGFGSQPK